MKPTLIFILIAVMLSSCRQGNSLLELSLEMAGDNRQELQSVIDSYGGNPQKREAAEWLIANMPGHSVDWSDGIQAFADSVMTRRLAQERGNELWDSLRSASPREEKRPDIRWVRAEFLTDNIDRAFEAWEKSPWRDEVDFERFKKYVLPYRVGNELLRIGWRDSLRKTYLPLVSDARTAKEAFERIRKEVNSVKRNGKYDFPYLMDPVALRNHYSGVCLERCVLLASICRAVGLPVVIDNCGKWANYSNNSHTWVSLLLADGTYTIVDDDSIARRDNVIDASTFRLNQPMPEGYPYTPEFRKRLVKVWRQTYFLNPVKAAPEFKGHESMRLSSPRLMDVSEEYGLTGHVEVEPQTEVTDVWLCTHSLTAGWIPQAYAEVRGGIARFDNIGDSVVVLPMGMADGKEIPVGLPFYLSEGRKMEIQPDSTRMTSATFTRKYPITANWLNRYSQIPSARFEVSNSPDFAHPDTLYTIRQVPVFHNCATVESDRAYRYFRVIADLPSYANMDRFNIYDMTGSLITSESWGKKLFIDFGHARKIGRIEYFPWNDGNFVVPDHEYELAFWNRDCWQSIGRQISRGYELTFDTIPSGALLILHDLTEGKEERPFTLQNGKQTWW
ncbi:transglutaminase-like domain-containing protein [uncultured Duncaniella sp.]|uniref:transglutaminase-like domain-containing protein n=2 Tax=uncultured Duncaniella sp. TaxID=2768039 RepID=UPI00263299AF|nr:transglutaminase-like domain-containing protein [uncultured Duncaniella sp.]